MASLFGFVILAIVAAAAVLPQVNANCDVKTLNTSECRNIHYDSSEDFLYVTCQAHGTWFSDRYHLQVLLQYVNNELQCGDASHNFLTSCQTSTLTIQGTAISVVCNGKPASIDLSDCLGVDVDDEILFNCDYDSYYE